MHVYPGIVNAGYGRNIVVSQFRFITSLLNTHSCYCCFRMVLDTSHSMFYQSFDIKFIAQTSHLAFNQNPVVHDCINGIIVKASPNIAFIK